MNALDIKTFIYVSLFLWLYLFTVPKEATPLQCLQTHPKESLTKAKEALKTNRWDPQALVCLWLSYEKTGNSYIALKKMRDAEEQLPQHIINSIHDLLWVYAPELLARKEFTDRFTMAGGDCIIKNSSMIDGFGYLIIGDFYNPQLGVTIRHLAAFKCNKDMDNCRERNLVCPFCVIQSPDMVLKVRGYKIEEIYSIKDTPMERNLRYIKTVLKLQEDLYAR